MRKFKPFFNLFVLLTFISFILQSHLQACTITSSQKIESTLEIEILRGDPFSLSLFSFDEIVNFIESLEEDDLEWRYSEDEIFQINCWLATLARQGQLLNEDSAHLERDIGQLFFNENECYFASTQSSSYLTPSAVNYYQNDQILFTGLWKDIKKGTKKAAKKSTKFIKKYKKEIIIEAVVVIAGTITFMACAPVACAAAAIVTNESPSKKETINEPTPKSGSSTFSPSLSQITNEIDPSSSISANLQVNLEEEISFFKENLIRYDHVNSSNVLEKQELSAWAQTKEVTREHGAHLAHTILDEISDYTKFLPELLDESFIMYNKFVPESLELNIDSLSLNFNQSQEQFSNISQLGIVDNYEETISKAHEIIDQIFTVNQADFYAKEAKEYRDNQFILGILPPPNGMIKSAKSLKILSKAGKVPDRSGLTKAGRALAKHGGRENSVFPKPIGNPAQINQQGQAILDNFLHHPNKKIYFGNSNRFGEFIDITIPNKGGVRYSIKGEFITFLEP